MHSELRTPKPFFLLVAENDPDDIFFLEEALKAECSDWIYATVRDGVEMISLLEKNDQILRQNVSLILLDMNMPRKNGLETLRDIRKMSLYEKVPVVGYSTSDDPKMINHFMDLGGTYFLSKPYDIQEFMAMARQLRQLVLEILSQHGTID